MKIYFLIVLLTVGTSGQAQFIDPSGSSIQTRFVPPEGWVRVTVPMKSFGENLRGLPLLKNGELVKYYDGTTKPNTGIYAAVLEQKIGKRDLHQCADAVMRLRADYLWRNKLYSQIHFNFTNGFVADYDSWRKGKRISVKGNTVKWVNGGVVSNDYNSFWKYLNMVFAYAGSMSLSKELVSVEIKDMQIGDVFIRGGHPGHTAIVVDMIVDPLTGKKKFLLAQSFMPAQQTHVLWNPNVKGNDPWYPLNFGVMLITPEFSFYDTELMRFK